MREADGNGTRRLLAVSASAALLAGAGLWLHLHRSGVNKASDRPEADLQACRRHAESVLSAGGVTDSHAKGSGYIVLKATFTARTPLVISGDAWVPGAGSSMQLYAEMERTELRPGKPREVTIHLLVNPVHWAGKPLETDGPYSIQEIEAYVYDPAVTERWGTWAGETSCKAAVIKNITTGPYKAADFKLLNWSGDSASTFPGSKAAKKGGGDYKLAEQARELLRGVDEELRNANGSKLPAGK